MQLNQELFQRILNVSDKDPKTLNMRIMKLASEVGELCDVGLALTNTPSLRYKNLGRPELVTECADVILCIASVLAKADVTQQELTEAIERKVTKWEDILK